MKLSRTGWNNVIIFVVMIFILVINVTNKQLFSDNNTDVASEQSLLGNGSVILTLALNNNILIERIGRTWRATPAKLSGQALEQMMMSWQQVTGDVLTEAPIVDKKMALIITVNLAGQEQAAVLSLYSVTDELLVFNHQSQLWFSLPMQIFQQLLPSPVFNN
ncbi:MAG: hypothetical protein HRT52_03455 [Colwellia sp.]|nr:hypothetical protein [Colwellia sp.]